MAIEQQLWKRERWFDKGRFQEESIIVPLVFIKNIA